MALASDRVVIVRHIWRTPAITTSSGMQFAVPTGSRSGTKDRRNWGAREFRRQSLVRDRYWGDYCHYMDIPRDHRHSFEYYRENRAQASLQI
jgi:hypothetical protein